MIIPPPIVPTNAFRSIPDAHSNEPRATVRLRVGAAVRLRSELLSDFRRIEGPNSVGARDQVFWLERTGLRHRRGPALECEPCAKRGSPAWS